MNVKQRQYAGCEPWEFGGERWKSTKEGKRRKIHSGAFQIGWEFLEGHTVNGFLEQIERMIAYPARLFLSDPSLNPFNPLPESVDSSPRQQRQLEMKHTQTKLWLNFALDCDYIQSEEHKRLTIGYGQVSAMLWTLMTRWESFG